MNSKYLMSILSLLVSSTIIAHVGSVQDGDGLSNDFCQSLYTAENSCSGYKSLSFSFRFTFFFGNFKHCSIVGCEGSELARDLADLFLLWDWE